MKKAIKKKKVKLQKQQQHKIFLVTKMMKINQKVKQLKRRRRRSLKQSHYKYKSNSRI